VGGGGGAELLRAAAAQRMNTETRRAVFCVVMGSQDYIDASERLLRLHLKVLLISTSFVMPIFPVKEFVRSKAHARMQEIPWQVVNVCSHPAEYAAQHARRKMHCRHEAHICAHKKRCAKKLVCSNSSSMILIILDMWQGEAEREVVRVTVECCLQERSWNAYYAHLLSHLIKAVKGHRITLQYCLWDHFKQVWLMGMCWDLHNVICHSLSSTVCLPSSFKE
jgi:hypothetical protein